MTPYRPRPLRFLGVEEAGGFRLKAYAISEGDRAFDPARFDGGWELARQALPSPPAADGRPRVGFAVLHQARGVDYFVLGWWDRENELPTRVFVADGGGWRPAAGGESFCVWDLRVMWWEREAYVGTVLAGRDGAVEAYLASVVEGYA